PRPANRRTGRGGLGTRRRERRANPQGFSAAAGRGLDRDRFRSVLAAVVYRADSIGRRAATGSSAGDARNGDAGRICREAILGRGGRSLGTCADRVFAVRGAGGRECARGSRAAGAAVCVSVLDAAGEIAAPDRAPETTIEGDRGTGRVRGRAEGADRFADR